MGLNAQRNDACHISCAAILGCGWGVRTFRRELRGELRLAFPVRCASFELLLDWLPTFRQPPATMDAAAKSGTRKRGWFATTCWGLVLPAGRPGTPGSEQALDELCRTYWYPIYAYVRRRGHSAHDAQDLTQAFFVRLLQGDFLAQANPSRGRFRSFLLVALNHFLADEWDRAHAAKRGGGQTIFSLDAEAAENLYALEPADVRDPEKAYERRWAMTVLDLAAARLRQEYVESGKGELFELLRQFETGDIPGQSGAELAARLGMPENTFKSHLRRMRMRHRELVREVVVASVKSPAEADAEIQHLMTVLGT